MDEKRLVAAIEGLITKKLATELVVDFVKIRRDYATRTLERASTGKFVETFVQALQYMATNTYDTAPSVDHYLDKKAEQTTLSDGLRICAARIARAMYTLRNKRNVAHKNEVDPNTYDLAFAHQSAAWILAELLRSASGITMEEAGALIALIQAPVGTLVEEIGGTRLVHADVSVRDELLLLLHSHYPDLLSVKDALTSLRRRDESSVRKGLRELDAKKLAHGDTKSGYLLSTPGHQAAVALIQKLGS
ncbi:hypothetical protein [Rhodanobacter sp. C05]|uniref:hypothetical protein n=1 Tax=Rhodanobacter sp. C05 TaxID=1945855 RepID=UPI000986082C|nr:hypothetical protein [Rhodanobacter sp. C05]OOG37113.1 hypothetical protein B0E51_17600 [Rhodanobacter sp. C05]